MTVDYAARWAALAAGEEEASPADEAVQPSKFNHYRPLVEAADEFVKWAKNPQDRVTLGIDALDAEMRGIAPGELALIIGYSHGGKTLTLLEALKHNRKKRVIYFCPDEPRTLTLVKLTCVLNGMRARELETRILNDDRQAIDLLRRTATDEYPTLAVFDEAVTLVDMERGFNEVADLWGGVDLVVFDYLELLNGGGEDVPSKANALKAWGKRHHVPMVVLHQTSRTSGGEGKKLTLSSGAYGGEQQALFLIGVRRKEFEIQARINELEAHHSPSERNLEELEHLRYLLEIHRHTLTVSLLKNKRPDASRLPEIDYEIEAGTGRLWQLNDGDMPRQYLEGLRKERTQ